MRRDPLKRDDSIGMGWNGPLLDVDYLKRMRLGEEYHNVEHDAEIVLRVTGVTIAATTKLFLQLEERFYDGGTVVLEKYLVERG